jgi:hypothetical protein
LFKKLIIAILAGILGFSGVIFFSSAANASETKKEAICTATASDVNPYNQVLVARDSIINGGHGQNGVNEGDIIPPFDYNFDGGPVEHYPGQNWTPENQILWTNGCNPSPIVLTPVVPVPPIATCSNPNPTLTIPAQPNGINVSSTADDKGNFTIAFELPKNTPHTRYVFPEGFVNPVNISTIDNRQSDPLWDPAKGECVMPETGAGQSIAWWMVPAAGALFAFAAILFTFNTIMTRRKPA